MLLGQQSVNLLDEFQSCVLLVQDQSIDRVQSDRDLASVEEKLELVPIVALAPVVLSVREGVHADVLWEVAAENLGDANTDFQM